MRSSKGRRGRIHIGLFHSHGCWIRGTGENMDKIVGSPSTEKAEWARDESYQLGIGMEGSTEG